MKQICRKYTPFVLLAVILFGCTDGEYSEYEETNTGSFRFSIEWEGAPAREDDNSSNARALDCLASGVETVTFEVLDENSSLLADSSWSCSVGRGTVENVPAGANRTLVVYGKDTNDNILYRGEKYGLEVIAGQNNDVGLIVCFRIETFCYGGIDEDNDNYTDCADSDCADDPLCTADYYNPLGMGFNLIPAGTFMMGSPPEEVGREADEIQHQVTLTNSFYMQTTEVTQGQWEAVMGGNNPSYFISCGKDCPVEQVSWDDIVGFLGTLNYMSAYSIDDGGTYRLPTEAEWEYAARAGSTTGLDNGNNLGVVDCGYDYNLNLIGWYCFNSEVSYAGCYDNSANGASSCSGPSPVARKAANPWGLYDMHGSVWEWVQDWYGTYDTDPVIDPPGPVSGSNKVGRGGSWYDNASFCRSASRGGGTTDHSDINLGFRIVREP